ncbi:hypothetical protein DWB78_02900 [Halopelagius longus]|uniref:Uncharacterized protein n=1 Tax=Halopelagius longus TaxID=1236180 RepID=A0A370IKS7_9EURY|nr:hypothetical protein DWB78_02900 [Halopelagius longus]
MAHETPFGGAVGETLSSVTYAWSDGVERRSTTRQRRSGHATASRLAGRETPSRIHNRRRASG